MGFGGPHAAFFATRDAVQARTCPAGSSASRWTPRAAGAAPGAADPRAAHPAREGDLQHLHRAGAAGGHRRHVRRLARAGGPAPDRPARPPAGRRAGRRRCAELGFDGRHESLLRHADRSTRPSAADGADRRPRRAPASTCAASMPTASASRSTRRRRAPIVDASARVFAPSRDAHPGRRRSIGRTRRDSSPACCAAQPIPDPPGLQPLPHRDRDAALPAPARGQGPRARPRHDPARLLHDEAERHDRDDPGHLARVRRPASVRARRPGRGLPAAVRRARGAGCARSPASPRSRCSPTPARRANTPACSRSAPSTQRAARRSATSA